MKNMTDRSLSIKMRSQAVGMTTDRSPIRMKSMGINCSIDQSRSRAHESQKSRTHVDFLEEQINDAASLKIVSMPSHHSQLVVDHQKMNNDKQSPG